MASISDILLAQGQRSAESRRRLGEISAGMWSNLGQQASGAIQQYVQHQQQEPIRKQEQEIRDLQLGKLKRDDAAEAQEAEVESRRNAAFTDLLSRGMPDPREVLTIYGPERGSKIAQGLQAFNDLATKRVADAKKTAGDLALGFSQFTPEMRQQLWPSVRQAAIDGGLGTPDTIPEDPTDEFLRGVVVWSQGEAPKQPGTREIKVRNADGSESIQIVTDTPGQTFQSAPDPKPMREVVVRGPNGRPVKKLVTEDELMQGVEQYQEPRAAQQPTYHRIETVDDSGNPIIQFLTPEEVRRQGGIRTSPKTTAKASGPATVGAILGEIETLSQRINTQGGGPVANVSGQIRRGLAGVNLDNEVSEYKALVEGFIPMVARAVGHTGVLTQADVDSVRALFPKPGDNAQLAKNKLDRVRRLMAAMQTPEGSPGGRASGAGKQTPDPLGIRK
jgi:hypothetical protein